MERRAGDCSVPDDDPHAAAAALNELVSQIYEELRDVAHRQLRARRSRAGGTPTLATTGLVHEAYLKLVQAGSARWKDREHFLALAGAAMRQVLVDSARARLSAKRGRGETPLPIDDDILNTDDQSEIILRVDDQLASLERASPRLARVVEYRFFGGLSEEETAAVLGVSLRTVQRDWVKARLLLRRAEREENAVE